jgi:hypothetical protein
VSIVEGREVIATKGIAIREIVIRILREVRVVVVEVATIAEAAVLRVARAGAATTRKAR